MASIEKRTNKNGDVIGYRFRACVGRDDHYKQVWRTATIQRPEGLTPKKEAAEVKRLADAWEKEQKSVYQQTETREDKTKITLASFIRNHWWKDHVLDGSHKKCSISFYRFMSDDIIAYFGERKRLSQIDAESIKRYIGYLQTEATTQDGKPLSPTTVKRHFETLRNILNYALRFGYIQSDPFLKLSTKDKPHRQTKQIEFLKPDEARKFILALESEPLYWKCFMNIILVCGLRRGECIGLKWSDINSKELTISINRNVTIDQESPQKYAVTSPKSGKPRTVPLSHSVSKMLESLKASQKEKYGAEIPPTAYIFCREENLFEPIYPTTPTRWQSRFVKRHNLPNVSPHDLRHTAATLALESGANLKAVQTLLGHSDASTTMSFYAGVTQEAQRKTVDGIENLIRQNA